VLVWSDEFESAGLPNAERWVHDTARNRVGWHNNELQYYAADRPENAVVRDGLLIITARRENLAGLADWGGQRYSSARLITLGKAAWTYGFFEVRARLPCGQGSWPAIWMLGSGGQWPRDGELDIMEHAGSDPRRVFSSVHTQAGSGGRASTGAARSSDACSAFHNYQMTWTASEIRFSIDGVVHHRYANSRTGVDAWPFDAAQFMILNLAVGGDIGGAVDDRIFPIALEIDHVRVYQAIR
jgi:beta-glucanase (GH16 family)